MVEFYNTNGTLCQAVYVPTAYPDLATDEEGLEIRAAVVTHGWRWHLHDASCSQMQRMDLRRRRCRRS